MFYSFAYTILWPLFKILFRFRHKNRKNILKSGAVIIVANHNSYLDPIVVGLSSPRPVRFMAKSELFEMPLLKNIVTWLKAFPVRRKISDRKAFKTAIQVLEEGGVVGLFPEGTRVKDKLIGPVHPGAALLALKTGAKVIPFGIGGTSRIIPPGKILPRFPKVRAVFGKPIDYNELKGDTSKKAITELTIKIEENLYKVTEAAERWSS